MIARLFAQTLIIWAVVFVGLLLTGNTQSAGLVILTKTIAGRDFGLTFSVSTALGLLGIRSGGIPLLVAVLLLNYPFPGMSDLASVLAPLGLGLLLGAQARGLVFEGKRRSNDSDQRTDQTNNAQ